MKKLLISTSIALSLSTSVLAAEANHNHFEHGATKSSGGGSMGLFSGLMMMGLLAFRRKSSTK